MIVSVGASARLALIGIRGLGLEILWAGLHDSQYVVVARLA